MALPTPARARQILAELEIPAGIVSHSEGVARVAIEAGRLVAATGIPVDLPLLEVAALLHDIDKPRIRRSGGEHGIVGAQMLVAMGYEELAMPVASHPVNCLLDEERFPRGWPSVLLAIADKHVAQEFMSIDERLDGMVARHPEYRSQIDAARLPARALEHEIAEVVGLTDEALVDLLRFAFAPLSREARAQ
ncbi:MAG: HDIG domain-containing protein [Chloroflexota bacterium]|nr:HDIG domain-containing protein [Chloroflexota bacterium]